jgi:hypothetical protein
MSRIVVLHFAVGEEPEVAIVNDDLETWQALVGGYLEQLPLTTRLRLIYNEDGRALGLPRNRVTPRWGVIRGPFFLTAIEDRYGWPVSLTARETRQLRRLAGAWPLATTELEVRP